MSAVPASCPQPPAFRRLAPRPPFPGWLGALTLLAVSSLPARAAGDVVISQIYGGGGNNGAVYRHDFIELFNRSANSVSLNNWTVQYAAGTSTNWQAVPLNGELASGAAFLVQLGSGGTSGAALPTPDATGSLNLSASAGKVALVNAAPALTGACPAGPALVDLVGYGGTANCFEGAAVAPGGANALAILRASGGCADSDNNSADFFSGPPEPRNRQTPARPCGDASTPLPLHVIQGTGADSPWIGQAVLTTTNIVTALRNNGFFLQARDSEVDGNPDSSEAIFVSAPSGLPAAAVVGNAVVARGIVQEFRPAGEPAVPPRTQLINASLTLVATGQPLPAPSVIPATALGPAGGFGQLERLESMRVRVNSLQVVGPTEGFVIESSASGISDGVFYGVLPGIARPMREPGISLLDLLPPGAPAGIPRFDDNPERLRVDSNAQPGAPRLEVTAGAMVNGLAGVLDFEQRAWTLLPDAGGMPAISGNRVAASVPAAGPNEFTVASFNLERFFDSTDDPAVDEAVLTEAAFDGRLNKASLAIRNVLRAPDILGLVEVENLAVLETLAARVNADALAAGQTNISYDAWLEEGNDIGGIDTGYLVNTSRVSVLEVSQIDRDATYLNPLTGQLDTLHDRPPLLLRAAIRRPGLADPMEVVVIVNHLRSLSGIDDPVDGPRIRAKRRAQAEHLARFVQALRTGTSRTNLILLGDFNAFPFNDGYVDVIGTIKGSPAPSNEVVLASEALPGLDLVNLTDELPGTERYSFNFAGNAQALDHILVDPHLRPRLTRYAFARLGSDFPESLRSNFNRPERLSDHDAPVAWFARTAPPSILSIRHQPSSEVELRWQSEPGQVNRIETSPNLNDWTLLATVQTSAINVFTDTNAPLSSPRFYRITVP